MTRISTKRPSHARADAGAPVLEVSTPLKKTDDYIERNRAAWEKWALRSAITGRAAWRDDDLRWGLWNIVESDLRLLQHLEPGTDVVELGCGTAVISAWLARRGIRPVSVDFSGRQLDNVKQLQHEFDLSFPLIHADAEQVPYDQASFDFAVSEYGASLWCDPSRWLAEARRLLRPGGQLVFFTSGAMLISCTPESGGTAGETLVRDYFSRYRVAFPGEDTVEFHVTHGDWVRFLSENGFVLEDLIEVRPPREAEPRWATFASLEWARRWPSEEIWVARKLDR